MHIKIRLAESSVEDAQKIKHIDFATFKDCTYGTDEIQTIIRTGQQIVFFAESASETIGFVSLMKVQTLHYHAYWIDLLAVLPEYQGRGIGQKLIHRAHGYATERKGEFVSALVRRCNAPSLKSFEKSSFKNEGEFNLLVKSIEEGYFE